MRWIGQNIYDQVSRFRNKVYFEGDIEFNTDTVTFQSANTDDPLVTIKNTSNAANDMARLNFVKERDGGIAAANDNCAEIRFLSKDASGNEQQYGLMLSEIDVATHGQESGRLKLGVASHDGENSYGLQITGGSVDNEVDVLLGTGDASATTIAGTLTMGSTATIDNNGAWVGGIIPSAKLDEDIALLSVDNIFTGATQTITSSGAGRPSMIIQNTGNNNEGGFLRFGLDKGAVGTNNDQPGSIQWRSDNDAQQQVHFGKIYNQIEKATNNEECGKMILEVALNGTLKNGINFVADSTSNVVNATIGNGTASTTTIAGTLTMGSTATIDNNGVWVGGVIPSAKLDADTAHLTGNQTLGGVKTFNQAINKKALFYIQTQNKFTNTTANEYYFSLTDAERDVAKGSEAGVGVVAMVPCNGILKQVILNTGSNISAQSWEWKVYRVPNGTVATSEILIATVASNAGPTGNTNKVISFVSGTANTNVITYEAGYNAETMFTAGDRVLFSQQSSTDASGNPKINIIMCFELDESTIQ